MAGLHRSGSGRCGPAAGTPHDDGHGRHGSATPHQMEVLGNKGGPAIESEKAGKGGPGQPGRPSAPGTEAGPAPNATGSSGHKP